MMTKIMLKAITSSEYLMDESGELVLASPKPLINGKRNSDPLAYFSACSVCRKMIYTEGVCCRIEDIGLAIMLCAECRKTIGSKVLNYCLNCNSFVAVGTEPDDEEVFRKEGGIKEVEGVKIALWGVCFWNCAPDDEQCIFLVWNDDNQFDVSEQ